MNDKTLKEQLKRSSNNTGVSKFCVKETTIQQILFPHLPHRCDGEYYSVQVIVISSAVLFYLYGITYS